MTPDHNWSREWLSLAKRSCESSSKEARIIMEHEYRKCMETVFICPRWEVVVFLNLLPLNWVFRAHSHNLAFGISNSEVSPNGSVWKMYNRHVSDCLSCDQQFQLARGCNCMVHDGNELQLALPASVLLLWSEAVLNLLILWAKVKKSCFRAVENHVISSFVMPFCRYSDFVSPFNSQFSQIISP